MSIATDHSNGKSRPKPAATALLDDEEMPTGGDFLSEADLLAAPRTRLPEPPKRPRKRWMVLGVLGVLLVAGAIVGTLYFLHARQFESTDDATVEGRIIPISPQIAARVKAVRVADNALVHKGDVLVELDTIDYQVALEQARASESAAQGRLTQAQAQVDSVRASRDEAKAEVAVAEANAQMAQSDHDRYVDAANRNAGAISKQQLDNATATWRSTDAQVQQARAKLAAAEAQIATAQAGVEGAKGDLAKASADVHKAVVNFSYCTITAPEEGRITRKNVEPGSYVQAGQNLFAIVPPEFWVVANFKETQLDRMRPGQPVKIQIDAYPERQFTGHVDSIQSGTGSRFSVLPAENATGNYVKVVQRVPVKIVLDPGQTDDATHPLAAGMSAVPEVKVE
jgi:membrane fusion protein (multidrug efflux system)